MRTLGFVGKFATLAVAMAVGAYEAHAAGYMCEYIDANSSASVDTGYADNIDTVVFFKGAFLNHNGNNGVALFTDYVNNQYEATRLMLSGQDYTKLLANCYTRASGTTAFTGAGQAGIVEGYLTPTNSCINGESKKMTSNYRERASNTVKLHPNNANTRLYYFRAMENGNTICDWRPYVKDGVAGYVELRTFTFRTNTAGALTAPSTAFSPSDLGEDVRCVEGALQSRILLESADASYGSVAINDGTAATSVVGWMAYEGDDTFTIKAVPAAGCTFVGWTGDTVELTSAQCQSANLTLPRARPRNLKARFINGSYPVGVARSWTGLSDELWSTPANWEPLGPPAAGDDITIENGSVTIDCASAKLKSFTLTGSSAKLTFKEATRVAPESLATEVNATTVKILNGATVTHVQNSQTYDEFTAMATPTWQMDGRVNFVCTDFELDSTSKIDANYMGYVIMANGLKQPGPGGINGINSNVKVTPSYGAWSACTVRYKESAHDTNVICRPYGSAESPIYPGTAGGRGSDSTYSPGGGAIRIKASGKVTLNGQLLANGGGHGILQNSNGSGTGGSIWISCASIAGSGTLQTNSGEAQKPQYTGSGGRIAIVYDPAEQDKEDAANGVPTLHFSSRALKSSWNALPTALSRPGTVYFPDARFLGDTFSSAKGVQYGTIVCGDWSKWNPTESLTLDTAVIDFQEGPALSLNLSGKLKITGSGSELSIGGSEFELNNYGTFHSTCLYNGGEYEGGVPKRYSKTPLSLSFGSVEIGENASLQIFAGPTNGTDKARNEVAIAGALTLSAKAMMLLTCHGTDGAVTRVTADSLSVGKNASIYSDNWGYQGNVVGLGPGARVRITQSGETLVTNCLGSAGSSYGGAGAVSRYNAYKQVSLPYGDPAEPIWPGSGGNHGTHEYQEGSYGGGAVWLEIAGDAVVNGYLSANGGKYYTGCAVPGTGGSVYLKCRTLSGSGTMRASAGGSENAGSSSSGGRIAVKYDAAAQKAIGCPNIIYNTRSSNRDGADFGSVYFTDETLLSNILTETNCVYGGSVYLGSGWENWRPDGLVVSNAYARLMCGGHHVTIDGDVNIYGNTEFGFGGGAYACSNAVKRYAYTPSTGPKVTINGDVTVKGVNLTTAAQRCEFWMHAGTPCGTDARTKAQYGAQLEVYGKFAVTTANAYFKPMCHPNDGWGARVWAEEAEISNGGSIYAVGCGYQGASSEHSVYGLTTYIHGGGPGGGVGSGGAGSYGGLGGGNEGPTYGDADLPLQCGSGAGSYNGNSSGWDQYPGSGGGLIWLDVWKRLYVDGAINANGGKPSGDHNGGGSGGGVYLRCQTWEVGDNVNITADGGNSGTSSGYGGGGGRIAIWRQFDTDATALDDRTYLSVATGVSKSGGHATAGTIRWNYAKPDGSLLLFK